MDQNITIRPAQAGDVEVVQRLFEQEGEHNGCSFDADSPYHPANAAVAVVNASMDPADKNCGWLAFSDGKPAGVITTPDDLPGGVCVSKEFRGQGIAQALVRERERYFKEELGLTEVQRPIRADNEASLKLHTEKLGYHFSQASLNLLRENPKPPGNTVLYVVKSL
jgi:ribosomal protein S18 acetylase RimI-like enzyme